MAEAAEVLDLEKYLVEIRDDYFKDGEITTQQETDSSGKILSLNARLKVDWFDIKYGKTVHSYIDHEESRTTPDRMIRVEETLELSVKISDGRVLVHLASNGYYSAFYYEQAADVESLEQLLIDFLRAGHLQTKIAEGKARVDQYFKEEREVREKNANLNPKKKKFWPW